MSEPQVIDVSALIGGLKLGRFHVVMVGLCLLTLLVDGMDFSTVLVTSPAILREWNLEQSAMGIVFGAGNFGLVLGAIFFGMIGDRFGRRAGIIASLLTYALPAIATGFVTGVNGLLVFRFLSTFGMGGGIPNAVALLTENAPRRYRASFVIIALIGTSLGAAADGGLAAAVIRPFGWQSVFFVVGFSGLLVGAIQYFALNESIPFVAVAEPNSSRLRRLVKAAAPRASLSPGARFVAGTQGRKRLRLSALFQGPLHTVTPLVWAAFFAEGLTFVTLVSWMVVLLESDGISPTMASLAFAYSAISGIFMRLLLARLLDRFGASAVLGAAAIAVAAFVSLGTAHLSSTAMIAIIVLATAFSTGAHDGLNSIVGGFYPTEIRANGVGWAAGASRLAAIFGPVAAGYMLSAKFSFATMMYALSVPYVFVILFCLGLSRGASRPDEAGRLDKPVMAKS